MEKKKKAIRTDEERKINFTLKSITGLPVPEKGRVEYYDTKVPHLLIRVHSTGKKTFMLYRWHHGRPVRVTIGTPGSGLSIEQVRKEAERLNAEFAAGNNPAEQKRAMRNEDTFDDLFCQYLERHAKQHKLTWQADEESYKRHIARPLGKKRLSAITRKDIADLHVRIGKDRPTTANRILALISSVFGRAIEFGLWAGNNPCAGIRRYTEEARDRFLSGDELRRFFEALELEPNETTRDFFAVALLTGARRANVLEMKWADLDLEAGTWRIGRTKNGTPQTVALVPAVVELLRIRREQIKSLFVFPGSGKTGHLVEPKKGWARICKAAGIEGARIHDLRRTMGSWQAMTGASLPVIGKSLNHKNQATTAIYARLDLDPVRCAMEKAADAMMATRDQEPKVVKLRQAGGE
ncbi:tyrosine-type recombinase/integrase [Desulfobulbus alkaliphilus]|uniref:tyrosine-type recombinase/integrase n=1 Tax=Desulfobulbus alkaliphilus TaxID=869814 RepID=UPI00196409BB|nr:site-specific integrase [Desulfobulbus alkaliphilus]MBM9536176.1 tyrosine-type recombinase/integrase [Desulfobulbus alkaliphilus]